MAILFDTALAEALAVDVPSWLVILTLTIAALTAAPAAAIGNIV